MRIKREISQKNPSVIIAYRILSGNPRLVPAQYFKFSIILYGM